MKIKTRKAIRNLLLLFLLLPLSQLIITNENSLGKPKLEIISNNQKNFSEKTIAFCDPELYNIRFSNPNESLLVNVIVTVNPSSYQEIKEIISQNPSMVIKKYYETFYFFEVDGPLNDCISLRNIDGITGVYLNTGKQIQNFIISDTTQLIARSQAISNQMADFRSIINIQNIQSSLGLSQSVRGKGVVVAILDSGIDFSGQIGKDLDDIDDNPYTFDLKPISTVSMVPYEPFYYSDLRGSGTFHAGVAVGTGERNSAYRGIAPDANLLNVKVIDSIGFTYYSFVISGLEWALTHDADVVCLPWIFPGYANDPISIAVNNLVDKGVIVVVPVGDDGPAYTSIYSPGQSMKAISVGAYDHIEKDVANFSSRGPSYDLRTGPDIIAPGVYIGGPAIQIIPDRNALLYYGLGFQQDLMATLANLQSSIGDTLPPYGEEISGASNYTAISSTTAAAAIVAGACALLVGIFPTATPELIKLSLMKTSHSITGNYNAEGAGLVDITEAAKFLAQILPNNYTIKTRIPQLSIYPGFIASMDYQDFTNSPDNNFANWDNYNVAALLSTQAMMTGLVVFNSSLMNNPENIEMSEVDLHTPLNQFGISFNNTFLLFSELQVIREIVNVTPYKDFRRNDHQNTDRSDYCRFVGMLAWNNELFIAITVESWSYTYSSVLGDYTFYKTRVPAFKFSFTFQSLSTTEFTNLKMYSFFKSDLYVNEYEDEDDGYLKATLDDEFFYDNITQKCAVVDQNSKLTNSSEWTSMGFSSISHKLFNYEINQSTSLLSTMMDTKLQFSNGSETSPISPIGKSLDADLGFAQSWLISTKLTQSKKESFNGIFGVGKGNSKQDAIDRMNAGFTRIQTLVTNPLIRDLAVVQIQTPRMSTTNSRLDTSALFINFGNTILNNYQISYIANYSSRASGWELFTYIETVASWQPMTIKKFEINWYPSNEGIFVAGWLIGNIEEMNSRTTDENYFNNYQGRNIFIYSYQRLQNAIDKMFYITPQKVPLEPFILEYPGDFIAFNITLFSALNIGQIQITKGGTASSNMIKLNNTKYDFKGRYGQIDVTVSVPLFSRKGAYALNINLTLSNWKRTITFPIQFTIEEPEGRILFDGIHNKLFPELSDTSSNSLLNNLIGNNFNLAINNPSQIITSVYRNLLQDRLDTIFGNYYSLRQTLYSISPKGISLIYLIPGISSNSLMGNLNFASIFGGNTNSTNSTSTQRTSLAFDSLFPGDNFFKFENETTTGRYSYDLIKFFDAIIFTEIETPFTVDEINALQRYLSLGGRIFVFCDNRTDNIIDNTNTLLKLGGLSFNSTINNIITLNITKDLPSSLNANLSQLLLDSPLTLNATSDVLVQNITQLLNPYMAIAQIGAGKLIAIGDGDVLKESNLYNAQTKISNQQNKIFITNLINSNLDERFDINITLSERTILKGESTFISITLDNPDQIKYLEKDFLAIMGIIDLQGNMINATLYGFKLPIMPVLKTTPSSFYSYFDSNWFRNASDFTLVVLLDTPNLLSQIYTFEVRVRGTSTKEKVVLFTIPTPEYPLNYDIAFVLLALLSITVFWAYSNYKWKSRHRYIAVTDVVKNKVNTLLSSVDIAFRQMKNGVENPSLSELEKLHFLLDSEKDTERMYKEINNLATELGEK